MLEQLFGSRARVKLLSFLYLHPDEPFYVRELTRKLGEQINSVRRELANLQSIGLVRSFPRDRRLYYELNPDFPYYHEFKRLFVKAGPVAGLTDQGEVELTRSLRGLGPVKFALVAGAFLRKQATVDLFLVGNVNKVKLSRLISELERELGRELNFTVMGADEFFYRRSLYDRFLADILDSDKMVLIDELGTSPVKRPTPDPETVEPDPEPDLPDEAKEPTTE